MNARRSKSRTKSPSAGTAPQPRRALAARSAVDRVRPWCLLGATALFVARPLWPSDSATVEGAGLPVAFAWFLLVAVWLVAGWRDGRLSVQANWVDLALVALVICI